MLNYRKADVKDVKKLEVVLHDAIAFLEEQQIDQWQNDTLKIDVLENAIAKDEAYVWELDGEIVGFASLEREDPYYETLNEGAWRYDGDFYAIHRVMLANSARGKGLIQHMFQDIKTIAASDGVSILRIDTHFDNIIMQKAIEKGGFVACGGTTVADGGDRIVYDQKL